ncbi:hypothetical protein OXB_2956 [Bacillus sp. OxB-1]|uniref:hypothetical protein n=1 Tax=Bacillus sp. (strain OxB-1) TaxID=98228 RepID=UPI000581BBC3|nr:hypothetical protein [Bacillus sp. OxB-1]BAQ11427.1 hypothetical protein OXB_2956 [Bacillus sp. OxB-1]
MKTKVTTVDGKIHLINGHPEDYMKQVNGLGVSRDMTIRTMAGQKIKMADIMMMQLAKE